MEHVDLLNCSQEPSDVALDELAESIIAKVRARSQAADAKLRETVCNEIETARLYWLNRRKTEEHERSEDSCISK